MDIQQKQNVLNYCNQILSLNVISILESFGYSSIGNYSSIEIAQNSNRVAKQLKEEIENGIGFILPFQYQFYNEFGGGNLESDLNSYITYIQNQSYVVNVVPILERLMYYQVANGFWDKSNRKVHNVNEVKIQELGYQIQQLEERLKNEISSLINEKNNVIVFLEQKRSEFQQISSYIQTASNNNQEISNLLNFSTVNNEKINSLVEQQTQILGNSKSLIEEEKNKFETYNESRNQFDASMKKLTSEFEKKNVIFKEILDSVSNKKDFFDERSKYLDQLIGREVGASLFETFKQRKMELKDSVSLWTWLVPITVILTILYIFLIFYLSPVSEGDKWETITVNSLKSIPAIFLLYFVTSQYKKERNFQEEYAFKSAVALTIMAYAEQIKADDSKDAMIIDAVKGVYETPLYRNKQMENKGDSSSILEGIKAVKETVVEAIKSK